MRTEPRSQRRHHAAPANRFKRDDPIARIEQTLMNDSPLCPDLSQLAVHSGPSLETAADLGIEYPPRQVDFRVGCDQIRVLRARSSPSAKTHTSGSGRAGLPGPGLTIHPRDRPARHRADAGARRPRTARVRGGVRGATVHRLPWRPCPSLLLSMPCVLASARRTTRPFPSCASTLPPVALPRGTGRSGCLPLTWTVETRTSLTQAGRKVPHLRAWGIGGRRRRQDLRGGGGGRGLRRARAEVAT